MRFHGLQSILPDASSVILNRQVYMLMGYDQKKSLQGAQTLEKLTTIQMETFIAVIDNNTLPSSAKLTQIVMSLCLITGMR